MKVAWGALRGWARRRLGALRWRTVLVLLAFVCVVAYAGLLAPHRPLFGWVRVVPLDFDEPQAAPVPGKRNIFFMETSCVAADPPHDAPFISESGLRLSPRSACAVEAAAAANPMRPVYLAHSCPVDAVRMWQGGAPAYALAAVSLPNVHVWPFRAPDQFRDSPLNEWFANRGKGDAGRRWWVTRVRDAMRYLLLWRYGGTYLDTDVFVLKSLENERDFAPQDWSGRGLSAVMLDLSWSKLGRRLANATLEETELLQPAAGLHSEADAVLAALTYVCATPKTVKKNMGSPRVTPPTSHMGKAGLLWLLGILLVTVLVSFYFSHPRPRTFFSWLELLVEDPLVLEPIPGDRHIMFLETSCLPGRNSSMSAYHNRTGLRLTRMTACALEAAATLHPQRTVFLMHTCPINEKRVLAGEAPIFARNALKMTNVHIWPIRFSKVLAMSPASVIKGSLPKESYVELLKYVLLWYYGGTIIHPDVLLLRSIKHMQNFASSDVEGGVGEAVVDLMWDSLGKGIANETITALLQPSSDVNHSQTLSFVLRKRCLRNKVIIPLYRGIHCNGFTVFSEPVFNPIPASLRQNYFSEYKAEDTLSTIKYSFGANTWNTLFHSNVSASPASVLGKLMKHACPLVTMDL